MSSEHGSSPGLATVAEPPSPTSPTDRAARAQPTLLIKRNPRMLVALGAGAALISAWGVRAYHGPEWLSGVLVGAAFVLGGIPAVWSAWGKLRARTIDIDVLMLLGACLAAYIGSPFEGALLLFLFALSGGMESYATNRARRAITDLHELTPKEANLLDGEEIRRVSIDEVAIGARLLVRPGEKIPLDGTVIAGASSVNEAAITGESIPRDCGVGDAVYAGTQNLNGRLEFAVTKLVEDTTLGKVLALVASAQAHPTRAQRLIDRIGPPYTWAVIGGSILAGLINAASATVDAQEAIRRAIAVLIVASPCALIIATPAAYLSAIAAAARRGVLIKGGAYLEVLAKVGAVVFDKTGTLTTGQIKLTEVETGGSLLQTEALEYAGGLERSSNHPLARAVARELQSRKLRLYDVSDYSAEPGEGASGSVGGRTVWVGRPEALGKHAATSVDSLHQRAEEFRSAGLTVSAFAIDGQPGLFAFQDVTRERARECVVQLRKQGVRRVEMFTGDHELVARRVAGELGLDGYLAALKPDEKLAAAGRLRETSGPVALVGDGINDAPALADADVGIAMGAIGTDIAMDAAHVVLLNDRIENVAWLHGHAKRAAAIVRQNLTVAIGVIVVLVFFAAARGIPLPLAVIGHEGSTVLVALNALRLLRSSKGRPSNPQEGDGFRARSQNFVTLDR